MVLMRRKTKLPEKRGGGAKVEVTDHLHISVDRICNYQG